MGEIFAQNNTADDNECNRLYRAVESSGCVAYTMSFHQGFPAKLFAGNSPLGKAGDTVIMGDVVHPDDYQPLCEELGRVILGTADEIRVRARIICRGEYRWFYITGRVRQGGKALEFIDGMMLDITPYLDRDEDEAIKALRGRKGAALNEQGGYTLRDVLGEDYLVRIQQPFTQTKGLYSVIIDCDGKSIFPQRQNKRINVNKMDYQRKKSIRVNHKSMGSWIISGGDEGSVEDSAQLLDTMVRTVSGVANSYVALVNEMETSQNANRLLGQNFEDQILVNGVYSTFLQSPDTKTAIRNITLLISEHFALSSIEFCIEGENHVKAYKLDKSGLVLPVVVGADKIPAVKEELDFSGIICTDLRTIGADRGGKSLSCVLVRTYDQDGNRGALLYIAKTEDREWNGRERSLFKTLTQLLSTVVYKLFLEEELRNSRKKLERLAYYDAATNIPNRSLFEKELSAEISSNRSGAVIGVEFSNLKNISEIYGIEYSDDILKSCAEYILAMPCSVTKHVYRFSSDIVLILLSEMEREEAHQLAQAILTKFRSPWYLHDTEHHIRVYAGFLTYPHDAEDTKAAISAATHTLRLAKERRCEDAVCYSEGLEDNLIDNRMAKKLIIDSAEHGFSGFYYLYQPVLEMKTGDLHCCEATLFWGNKDMTIPRDKFMPIIDAMGLSKQFYAFAVDKICRFCVSVRENGHPNFRVSFNIPDNILNSEISVETLQSVLAEYSLPPSAVSVAVSESEGTLTSGSIYLQKLAKLGVNVIADDTGAGYFTAAPLDNPAVKTVKISVSRLTGDNISASFVRSLIKAAKKKGVAVCAKDIDSPGDITAIGGYDVDLIEGIFNGRPLRDEDFVEKMGKEAS